MMLELNDKRVSVLICTYNRHEMLDQALDALINRTIEKPDEVIVVNGGDERADEVVNGYIGKHGIDMRLVKTMNVNLATSRNIGLGHCTYELVAMTDDDGEVFPDWITQIKQKHVAHPEAGLIGGAVIGATSDKSLFSRLSDIVTFPLPDEPGYIRNAPGVNVSYKREVLDRVGLQDETLIRGEDVDFNWRIQNLGYKAYFHPDIKVIHHHRPNWRQFFQQHYMYGRAYYMVRRKWPEMYCVYPHGFKRARDFLKVIHFFVAIIYQPVLDTGKLRTWSDRIKALPILIVNHALWKWGMIHQAMLVAANRVT